MNDRHTDISCFLLTQFKTSHDENTDNISDASAASSLIILGVLYQSKSEYMEVIEVGLALRILG